MLNNQNKAARAAYSNELRELHTLYDRHECMHEYRDRDIWPWRVGICSCGKLLVNKQQEGMAWAAATSATKRRMFNRPGVKKWYKVTCNHDKQRTQSPT